MAEVNLDSLKSALTAEGVDVPVEALQRVFRKLENPNGCEQCGQPTKIGVASGRNLVTACCRKLIAKLHPEEPEVPADETVEA